MSFVRNSAFNTMGALVPAIAALLTVPAIIRNMGSDQYGALVLITSIVGYFAVVDINITAASVKFVSQYHAQQDHRRLWQVLVFCAGIYLGIGALGGGLIAIFSEALVIKVFTVPNHLLASALVAMKWAALGFLLGQLQAYLQSVLQALQRFDLTSIFESSFGTLASIITLAIALAGGGLLEVVIARTFLSFVNCCVLVHRLHLLLPKATFAWPSSKTARELVSFSGYSYLTKLAAIAAANSDKLFIGALVDVRALALFAVPAMLAGRVFGVVGRLSQVMFPMASALNAQSKDAQLAEMYIRATRQITYVGACFCLVIVSFSPELLHYWAGPEFGANSSLILILLCVACFVDSLTNLPSLLNDGLGRPKLTGVSAVIRALAGIGAAFLGISLYGTLGAAVAQLLVSLTATSIFLCVIHRISVPVRLSTIVRDAYVVTAPIMLGAMAFGALAMVRPLLNWPWFVLGMAAMVAVVAVYWWRYVLDEEWRTRMLWKLKRIRRMKDFGETP